MHDILQKKLPPAVKRHMGGFLTAALIAVLSAVRLYADLSPLALSALLAFEGIGSPPLLIAYTLGALIGANGPAFCIARVGSLFFLAVMKKLFGEKVPGAFLCFAAHLLGAALKFIIIPPSVTGVIYSVAEALSAAGVYVIFRTSYDVFRSPERQKKLDKSALTALYFAFMTASLAFADAEFWRVSVSSVLIIYAAILSVVNMPPPTAALYNMAAGFYYFFLSPMNPYAVCALSLAALFSAVLRRLSYRLIPIAYFAALPVAFAAGSIASPFTAEDLILASVLFYLTPSYVLDMVRLMPLGEEGEGAYFGIREKLAALSDAFSVLAESMDDAAPTDVDFKARALEMTEQKLCGVCRGKNDCGILQKVHCAKSKAYAEEFAKNYQLCRTEAIWQKRLLEEAEAFSGQLKCVSDTFLRLYDECKTPLKRDKDAEGKVFEALKKSGVRASYVFVGHNERAMTEVKLSFTPCRGKDMCDSVIKNAVQTAMGTNLERIGVKNCRRCRVCYATPSPYYMDAVKLSVPHEKVCGDSAAFARIDLEHYAIALSDGMGTGQSAAAESSVAAHMAIKLLASGMDLISAAKTVNSLIINRCGGKSFVTLDLAVINLFTGELLYLKNGAANGYIYTAGGRIKTAHGVGSPLGALGDCDMKVNRAELADGDTLIMMTDGIGDAFGGDERKILNMLKNCTPGSTEQLAEFIAEEALSASGKVAKDDMTVIAAGCIKRRRDGNNIGKKEA